MIVHEKDAIFEANLCDKINDELTKKEELLKKLILEYHHNLEVAKINRNKQKKRSYAKGYFHGLATAYSTTMDFLEAVLKGTLELEE